MTDLRKAAEDLLEGVEAAIKAGDWKVDGACDPDSAIVRLRQALAQPVDAVNMSQDRVDETAKGEQEPWPSAQCVCGGTIYFKYTPPVSDYHEGWEEGFKAAKREWVGLTYEEKSELVHKYKHIETGWLHDADLIAETEAKLKEKNT